MLSFDVCLAPRGTHGQGIHVDGTPTGEGRWKGGRSLRLVAIELDLGHIHGRRHTIWVSLRSLRHQLTPDSLRELQAMCFEHEMRERSGQTQDEVFEEPEEELWECDL